VQLLAPHRRAPLHSRRASASGSAPSIANQECMKMNRDRTASATDREVEDPSMRKVEWLLALVAAVTAGVLAFIR